MPDYGSAAPRHELDAAVLMVARDSGARRWAARRSRIDRDTSGRITSVTTSTGTTIRCRRVVVADGARSPWAACSAGSGTATLSMASRRVPTSTASAPTTRGSRRTWSFVGPTADPQRLWLGVPAGQRSGQPGCGHLATDRRPADVNLRRLIAEYHRGQATEWGFTVCALNR